MTPTALDLFVPAIEETTFELDIAAATLLAARCGGRVTAYHAMPDVAFVANANPLWDMKDVQANYGERCAIRAKRLRETFERGRAEGAVWREEHGDPSRLAPRAARSSDLILIHNRGQDDRLNLSDLHQSLLAHSGKGVLFLPGAMKQAPETILIGWNGSREAARAVDAARPLFSVAKAISIVTFGEVEAFAPGPDDLADTLCRHGFPASALHKGDLRGDTGGQLDMAASDVGADLIVVGAYGHARWREAVLGGVTRHMLTNPKRPTLMAH